MSFPTAEECVKFHGHLCGGVTMGYVLSRYAMDKLGADRGADLYCTAEFHNCMIDAVQCVTGCTMGKKNLVIEDKGNKAMTIVWKESGEGFRVSIDIKLPEGVSKSEAVDMILASDPEQICRAEAVKICIPANE